MCSGSGPDAGPTAATLSLPAKPSIAVLPFTNLSGDPEQEPFADGLTEDLITELSRHAGLFVIARHSSFTYKGRSMDARRIARELGVRYLRRGQRAAVRPIGSAINVKLIDAIGGVSLWAERFDRRLEDIFAVQDEVTGKIVEALIGRLVGAAAAAQAAERASRHTSYVCAAAPCWVARRKRGGRRSCCCGRRSRVDPDYAEAHRWLAMHLWAGVGALGRAGGAEPACWRSPLQSEP